MPNAGRPSVTPGVLGFSPASDRSPALVRRYDRLVTLVNDIAHELNREQVGREVELLVASGEGRKDAETHRMTGRARDGRLVHFTPGDAHVRPGDVVETVSYTHLTLPTTERV